MKSMQSLKKGRTIISIKGLDSDGLAGKHGVYFETLRMKSDSRILTEHF